MLEQLILYFVCKTKGNITKTQLIKFLYLSDLYSVKWTQKQLTDLHWCYYRHGPWNEHIDLALKNIAILQLSKSGQATLIQAKDSSLYTTQTFDFSDGLTLMLDNIRKEWAGSGERLNDLLDYVYETAPMVYAKEHHSADEKAQLNLLLEHQKLVQELEG